jgi:hypothetical protein
LEIYLRMFLLIFVLFSKNQLHDIMLFCKGREVYLSSQRAIAGRGLVIKDQSTDILRGVPLRNSCVGVSITVVFDTNAFLPYQVKGLLSLGDAIDESVIWDSADLCLQAD